MRRNVLIIDEKVSMPTFSYSKRLYNEVRGYLDRSLQGQLDKVCLKLDLKLEKLKEDRMQNKCVRVEIGIHPKTLTNFESLMQANKNTNSIQLDNKYQKDNLTEMLKGLPFWYSESCIYNNGNISTFDPKYQLWGLYNNIILDASAGIDGAYSNKDIFTVVGQERIIDHSNSLFTIVNFNTSSSNLLANEDEFYPEICKMIKKRHAPTDKTLILCHKDNAVQIRMKMYETGIDSICIGDEYSDQGYAINWFGNLIGRNDYSDFTQCWILGTPNIPYDQYLLIEVHDIQQN
ncbi:hypothetical protein [Paenibacillus odorifer]|uniref:hypothetical protein n=1 Tax=Paenibacillus TaxID=44249 RepID=UPI00096E27B5|nr:hypothetical protein [Paenibacillus odorifer]OME42757.1 hypothetical protein BSK58_11455 [Paenibacillus odorifer]